MSWLAKKNTEVIIIWKYICRNIEVEDKKGERRGDGTETVDVFFSLSRVEWSVLDVECPVAYVGAGRRLSTPELSLIAGIPGIQTQTPVGIS